MSTQLTDAVDLIGTSDFLSDQRFDGIDGEGYAVAVLDTGIDLDNPAFGPDANRDGVADRIVYARDFSQDGDGTPDDQDGHGTHVASIAAGDAPGYRGVAPGADIIGLQVLGNDGSGSYADIEAGLQWVVDNAEAYNITSVNLSLGPADNVNQTSPEPFLSDEFAALANIGVAIVVAAGNSYGWYESEGVSSLAADPNAIAVGATWATDIGRVDFFDTTDFTTGPDRIASFSQRSDDVDMIFAPGAGITAAAPGGGTNTFSGTSMAAPVVAGVIAVAQDLAVETLGQRVSTEEITNLLLETGTTIRDGDDENDSVANTGIEIPRVDMMTLAEAILALGDGSPPPSDPPSDPPPSEPPVDEDVPGDETTTAVFEFGTGVTNELELAGDQDWFRVDLTAGNTYTFALEGDSSGKGTLLDPLLVLHDANGAAVARNDDGGLGFDAALEIDASESGTFFLSAQAWSAETGTYSLTGTETAPTGDTIPADPSTTSTVVPGTPTRSILENAGDRDWHRLEVTAGASYVVALDGEAQSGTEALSDPYLEILDATGTTILHEDDDGGPDRNAEVSFIADETETLFVNARAFADGSAGGYAVTVEETLVDGDIPNDVTTGASLAPGETLSSAVDEAGDRDWIAVTLERGSIYSFGLEGSGQDRLNDPVLALYDAAGERVAFDDDSGEGFNAAIDAIAPATSGTFYVEARGYGGETGGYTLSFQESVSGGEIPGDPSTTATVAPGMDTTSEIDGPGDRDWFVLSVSEGETYTIDLLGASGGNGTLRDPFLRLHDESGARIGADDDGGALRFDSALDFTADADGTVFVSAGAFGDFGFGSYTMRVTSSGGDDHGDVPSVADEALVVNGPTAPGEIETDGDVDFFRLDVFEGGFYGIFVEGADGFGGTLSDPVVGLYDEMGDLLASADDDFGRDPYLTFDASETGPVWVGVEGFGGATGTYGISVDEFLV